ncbi:CLUMA_CG008149, isoform A [Clunio marinus]|uniref:CLUMA_CG008149, isoform A n=1 Tax=Clunio marinus TaxID=568069 RepID=A0A1J1I8B0_9DIPT|nr:CLUMA_CG008149, isoform A [Clunio marinus]
MSLIRLGDFKAFAKFVSFQALGGITTYYLMNPRVKKEVSSNDLIVTTGCDSGLGYSIAIHCHDILKMSVVACVQHFNSKGSLKLKEMYTNSNRFHMVQLDVTKLDSVKEMKKFVSDLLEKNQNLQLKALVNNAGVMCFGETEWQTHRIITQQIEVNLLGSIRVTKEFLPLVRTHKSRIINVTSHCGLQSIPGLPIYCASKAGLKAFNDGLRLDMKKYDIDVVNFIPGSFVLQSNITSSQPAFIDEMNGEFSEEQKSFYGDYFDRYTKALKMFCGDKSPQKVDQLVLESFEEALLENPSKVLYKCEPIRYKIYHTLFKITPQFVTDWLLYKFVALPEYIPPKSQPS